VHPRVCATAKCIWARRADLRRRDRKPSAASGCATGCGDEATELVLGERQSSEHLEGAVRTRCASELEQGEGDSVWAVYVMHPAALIVGAVSGYRRDRMNLRHLRPEW
jgi:hypothetical protein